MKYDTLFIAAAALMLTGCSHTVQGLQQDAQQNTPVVKAAAVQATQSIEQDSKKTGAVVSANLANLAHTTHLALLGTDIKAHIISDKDLDSTKNSISVVSTPGEIYLKGHVISASVKSESEKIARNVINKEHAPVVLNDQLTVSPS